MKYFVLIISFTLLSFAGNAQNKILPKTIVIKYKNLKSTTPNISFFSDIIPSNNINEYKAMFPSHAKLKSSINLSRIYILTLNNDTDLLNYVKQLNTKNEIEYAQPYYLPELLAEPNDPRTSGQYYLPLTKVFEAHEITKGDTNIVIGITDTGVDLLHPDLINNIKYNYNDPINGIDDDLDGFIDNFRGWDIADNDNNPARFFSSHGTMVAGMAAATCNNATGIYGVGYHTKFLPIKIMDSNGFLSGAYQGIVYAADQGCQIINCSWGSQIENPLCNDVIDYVVNVRNCLVVAAAGNARTDIPYYPAACEGVLNVANSNRYDLKSSKSTYGVEVDICAPGEQVLTTNGSDGYSQGWGTSFAAPLVAGAAALVKAKFPNYNGLQLGEQLRITADIIDTIPDNIYFQRHMGRGRLNVLNALQDTTTPSLRIDNYDLSGENSTFMPGDTLSTTFSVTNYLNQITNTVVQLTTNSVYVQALNNTFQTGFLGTLSSANNSNSPMDLVISNNTPFDHSIELDFKFSGYGYNDYQIFKTLVNPSFININLQNIETSLTSNGRIGWANSQIILGKGLIYKNQLNLLPNAGIIIGNGRENIASSVLGEFDFDITQVIDTQTVSNEYFIGNTEYIVGSKYENLPIKINQESRIYFDEELESCIFHSYKVINKGTVDIPNFAFSIFANWDIDNSQRNRVNYDSGNNIVYSTSTTENNIFAGIALISQDSCTPYAFDITSGGNGGLDITTDFGDEKKWFAITNPRETDGNTGDTINTAYMISSEQLLLPANDTLEFTFCFSIANTYYELTEKIKLAKETFYPPIVNSINTFYNDTKVYPNPFNNMIYVEINKEGNKQLELINSAGKVIHDYEFNTESFKINSENLKPGIYFIRVTINDNSQVLKIIKLEH